MKKRRNVALLIETSNHYAREVLHGIRAYMREHESWSIRLEERKRADEPPRWLARWKGDGIIARIENGSIARSLRHAGVPVVNVSAAARVRGFPCVKTDDETIARLAADHFLNRGLRSLAYAGVRGYTWSDMRRRHFARILASRGLGLSIHEEAGRPGSREPFHHDLASLGRWIRGLPRPTGIFASWDGSGAQILALLKKLRIQVPEEIAVLGVDNDDLLCDLSDTPLTSIDPNAFLVGYRAAEMLERSMDGHPIAPGYYVVPPIGVETRISSDMLAIEDREVSEALRFIRQNACRGIKVGDVLRKVPLSRRVLEARFKKLLGRTPHAEILSLQIEKARDLLAGTSLDLGQIAQRSGFHHVEYMSVAFKREFGMPPSTYRSRTPRRRSAW